MDKEEILKKLEEIERKFSTDRRITGYIMLVGLIKVLKKDKTKGEGV